MSNPGLQEKLIRESGIPVPPDAGTRKSYSLKPNDKCMEGAGSIGVLSFDLKKNCGTDESW